MFGSFGTVTGLDYDNAVETGRELRLSQTSTDITLTAFRAAYGDGNMDGQLDSTDLFAILAGRKYNHPEFGPATWLEGDFSGDDLVNSTDLFLILATGKYNQGPYTIATPPPPVPEPSSIVLAVIALAGFVVFIRRRTGDKLSYVRFVPCGRPCRPHHFKPSARHADGSLHF